MTSIYQQQSSNSQHQQDSVTKSQTIKSITSKQSYYSSIAQMAKYQLLNYQDINDDEFVILPQNQQEQQKKNTTIGNSQVSSCYMHQHATQMPVGANYQAIIPNIKTDTKYLKNNQQKMKQLKLRKVHDPTIDNQFYDKYKDIIINKFGEDRTYEDANHIRINFINKFGSGTFQEYLAKEEVCQYWEDYFVGKDKMLAKIKRRKKKNK